MKKKVLAAMLAFSLVAGTGVYASEDKKAEKEETKVEETAKESEDVEAEENKEEKSEEESEEKEAASEEDEKEEEHRRLIDETELEKYVTLGEYNGMPLEKPAVVVTEEMVDSYITGELEEKPETEKDADAEVAEGDIANINYVGTKDGEAFAGGSADNYDLEIGSGVFIEGFEDGVIGMKKGETRDIDLSFPEEYPAADLAGQAVVFTVTLNAIKHIPELSDDWIAENTDYKTIEEYKDGVFKQLEEEMKSSQENSLLNTAFSTIIENSEIKEYPEGEIQKQKDSFDEQIDGMAKEYGMERAELLEAQGMTEEEYQEQSQQYAEYRVKQILVIQAIMDAEGMTFESKEAEVLKLQMAQMMGATNFDQIIDVYGESEAYNTLGAQMVAQFILDHAEIEDEAGEAEESNVDEILEEMPEEETQEQTEE